MKSIIIYSTKYGSVSKAAERLKKELTDETETYNIIKQAAPVPDGYDKVIIGGSVYMGKIQKKLTLYIRANLSSLLTKKVGLFLCAGAADNDTKTLQLRKVFPPELYNCAIVKDVLGYSYDFEKMNLFEKLIIKKIKGDSLSVFAFYDENIELFAKTMNEAV